MSHPNFDKVFEVACDALGVGTWGVLNRKGHPIAFLVKNLMTLNRSILPMTGNFML